MDENSPEQREAAALRERISKLEVSRLSWKLLAICCVVLWLLSKLQAHVSYVFHVHDNQIDMTKSQWFHRDKTVSVTWRKDSQGELGWCAQDKNGRWYKFIDPPYDDDAN